MNCSKFTVEGKPCALPTGHPNNCDARVSSAQPVMTKAGVEAQQLVDAYQRPKLILARNPNCEKCHGRAYNELPEEGTEHSVCAKCGGYLYVAEERRISWASKPDARQNNDVVQARVPKTWSGKKETPDLSAARIAEAQRRAGTKQAPKRKARNYMAEASAQAQKDVNGMVNWNGF